MALIRSQRRYRWYSSLSSTVTPRVVGRRRINRGIRVCSQDVTACFTYASAATRLLATSGLGNACGIAAERLRFTLEGGPDLVPSDFHLVGRDKEKRGSRSHSGATLVFVWKRRENYKRPERIQSQQKILAWTSRLRTAGALPLLLYTPAPVTFVAVRQTRHACKTCEISAARRTYTYKC